MFRVVPAAQIKLRNLLVLIAKYADANLPWPRDHVAMDTRATLSMLRWLELAELEVAELGRQRTVSRRCAEQEIVVAAQLVAVKRRLLTEHAARAA